MIKLGFIHGLIISVVIGVSAVGFSQLSWNKGLLTLILVIIVITSWYISARVYKEKYGSLSLISESGDMAKLFKFGFGASLVWGPFITLATIEIAEFNLPIYLVTLVIVIPLATVQVVGALVISSLFIKNVSV